MKRDWIKLDVGLLSDPRYGTLPDDLWRLVIQLNMLAGESDCDGLLPPTRDMAWMLHIGSGTLHIALHHLAERGLVHSTPMGWVVTDFKESQAAPSSTERSRAFRKRHKSFPEDETEVNSDTVQNSAGYATRKRTFGASEMQLSRHIPVSKPVPNPVSKPGEHKHVTKSRRRHKPKSQPVDKSVDNPVEKGRKNSDFSASSTSSTSSLIKYLKTNLKIKLPLLELLDQLDLKAESENLRPSQSETLENSLLAPENTPFETTHQVPPSSIRPSTGQRGVIPGQIHEPEGTCTADKPVEKDRKNSDPAEEPP